MCAFVEQTVPHVIDFKCRRVNTDNWPERFCFKKQLLKLFFFFEFPGVMRKKEMCKV